MFVWTGNRDITNSAELVSQTSDAFQDLRHKHGALRLFQVTAGEQELSQSLNVSVSADKLHMIKSQLLLTLNRRAEEDSLFVCENCSLQN